MSILTLAVRLRRSGTTKRSNFAFSFQGTADKRFNHERQAQGGLAYVLCAIYTQCAYACHSYVEEREQ
eukprot:m.104902 g.104902  ORF g.104902 m.104902 type:complete len:68 (+) comp13267_c1_seq2:265-468(+)